MLYRSTDAGAPVLSGTAGALIAVLDACLKDGYQSKTVTIARSGSTATASCSTAHGYAADGLTKINHSGASQAEYNGDFTIFNVTTLTYDFAVAGTPATPATGTITAKVAPIGWGKPYLGTNKGVYRSSEATGTQLYLRVDDADPNADSAKTAMMRGYETMTDIDTGTGLFPTVAQKAGGLFFKKSGVSDSTARPWVLVGDGFEFHLFPMPNLTPYPGYKQFHFGDPASEQASDPFGCLIYGDTSVSVAGQPPEEGSTTHQISGDLASGQTGHYLARLYSQTGGAVLAGKQGNYILGGNTIGALGPISYPSPNNNGLYVAPLFISDGVVVRGQLKGIYQPLHARPLGNAGLVAAANSPIGRRLYSVVTAYNSSTFGETHLDIDGPWR